MHYALPEDESNQNKSDVQTSIPRDLLFYQKIYFTKKIYSSDT